MVINGFKITYNTQIPKSVIIYLRKRMNSLAKVLRKRLGNNYNVQLNFSKRSEAGYILVSPTFDYVDEFNGYRDLCISIRNHHSKKNNYDASIFLCDFDSWNDLRKFIIHDCVPYIKTFDKEGLRKTFDDYVLSEYSKINKEA